jgi:hypothetical protein
MKIEIFTEKKFYPYSVRQKVLNPCIISNRLVKCETVRRTTFETIPKPLTGELEMKYFLMIIALISFQEVRADMLRLPDSGKSVSFGPSFETKNKANKNIKAVTLKISNYGAEGEYDSVYSVEVEMMVQTIAGIRKLSSFGLHCEALPRSMGLVCPLIDSNGDVLISDSRFKGRIEVLFRPYSTSLPFVLSDTRDRDYIFSRSQIIDPFYLSTSK